MWRGFRMVRAPYARRWRGRRETTMRVGRVVVITRILGEMGIRFIARWRGL
jgi:hypothetical protein